MGIGQVLLRIASAAVALAGCATSGPLGKPSPGVALVEWQFPMDGSLGADSRQAALVADPAFAPLRPAFYPTLSEENASEGEHMMGKLMTHATQVAQSYAAGREALAPPFLLNISEMLPRALELLIAKENVRIVSLSSGSKTRLAGLDDVLRGHPEVLLVTATPHISGNSIGVDELGERPSVLATRGFPNVVLAGCLSFDADGLEADRAGRPLGSAENPFWIDNQPAWAAWGAAAQVFMMSCRSGFSFAPGAGATSAAAPHLASLLALVGNRLAARGEAVEAGAMLAGLAELTHRAMAREKTGEVREVAYFTIDTVLLNARRPLVTEAIWGDYAGHPAPRLLAP